MRKIKSIKMIKTYEDGKKFMKIVIEGFSALSLFKHTHKTTKELKTKKQLKQLN